MLDGNGFYFDTHGASARVAPSKYFAPVEAYHAGAITLSLDSMEHLSSRERSILSARCFIRVGNLDAAFSELEELDSNKEFENDQFLAEKHIVYAMLFSEAGEHELAEKHLITARAYALGTANQLLISEVAIRSAIEATRQRNSRRALAFLSNASLSTAQRAHARSIVGVCHAQAGRFDLQLAEMKQSFYELTENSICLFVKAHNLRLTALVASQLCDFETLFALLPIAETIRWSIDLSLDEIDLYFNLAEGARALGDAALQDECMRRIEAVETHDRGAQTLRAIALINHSITIGDESMYASETTRLSKLISTDPSAAFDKDTVILELHGLSEALIGKDIHFAKRLAAISTSADFQPAHEPIAIIRREITSLASLGKLAIAQGDHDQGKVFCGVAFDYWSSINAHVRAASYAIDLASAGAGHRFLDYAVGIAKKMPRGQIAQLLAKQGINVED